MGFHYRDLAVWSRTIDLVEHIYRLTKQLPDNEKFGLTAQLRRASVSIASNIAEGHSRNSPKDFCRFLNNALGSLSEVETQCVIAHRLTYISATDLSQVEAETTELGRMLNGLRKSILKRAVSARAMRNDP